MYRQGAIDESRIPEVHRYDMRYNSHVRMIWNGLCITHLPVRHHATSEIGLETDFVEYINRLAFHENICDHN